MDFPYKRLSISKTLNGHRLSTEIERKAAVEINSKEGRVPETKQQGRKRTFAFRDNTSLKCLL